MILFATRPLKREELYFGLVHAAAECQQIENMEGDPDLETLTRFITDSSKGLAETTRGRNATVQLIHESVRDYLLDSGLSSIDSTLAEHSWQKPCASTSLLSTLPRSSLSIVGLPDD